MKFRVGDIVEYTASDSLKLRGSIGIVRSRSALMVSVDWLFRVPGAQESRYQKSFADSDLKLVSEKQVFCKKETKT